MEELIKSKQFKKFVETLDKGCKLVSTEIIDGQIHATCLANSQNVILFKYVFYLNGDVRIINGYNLYDIYKIEKLWNKFISKYNISELSL